MTRQTVAVVWLAPPGSGQVNVLHGRVHRLRAEGAGGRVDGTTFTFDGDGPCRLWCELDADHLGPGAAPTIVRIAATQSPFSFFLRDVSERFPIVIPPMRVAVTTGEDPRSYIEIESSRRGLHLPTDLEAIDRGPEHTLEAAYSQTREVSGPVWLGASRDVRIFEVGLREPMVYTDWIRPRYHGHAYFWNEPGYMRPRYGYVVGRGWGCKEQVRRWMDGDQLPILHTLRTDDDVRYHCTTLVTLEQSPLTAEALRGTHHWVADGFSACHAITDEQRKQFEARVDEEVNGEDQTVLFGHVTATNTGRAPRYAFFKALHPHTAFVGHPDAHTHESATGFGRHKDDANVFGITRLNGKPMPQSEVAILLRPGEACVFEFMLPHQPIPAERAARVAQKDFDHELAACRAFWGEKLASPAQITVPEARVQALLRLGIAHIETTTYGREPDGPLLIGNGTYGPVAQETVPLLNFLDSVGMHDTVRRAIEFYFQKQRGDGFLQTFAGYTAETACLLWLLGEHYRYTRDQAWARRIAPRLLMTCEYLLKQRTDSRAKHPERHGLLAGQVADPADDEMILQLNGYAHLGLSRATELLHAIGHDEAQRIADEAASLKQDVRAALREMVAQGPVVPLADGSWRPAIGPWYGATSPCCLGVEDAECWSHGTMTIRDDALGPLPLVIQEVLEPREPLTDSMLEYHAALYYSENVSFSQPCLSRQSYLHLLRRETKRFLKTYYNQIASITDRQTYSFWEHFYHVSPHKLGEEAQLLMQTRQMLYLEEGDTLALLRGVPRRWLAHGERIELDRVASYFGPLSLHVTSCVDQGVIEATVECGGDHRPRTVELRLPHPRRRAPLAVEGGVYDAEREAVVIESFTEHAAVRVTYPTEAEMIKQHRPGQRNMRFNVGILFDKAPPSGRVEVEHGRIAASTMMVGWGEFSNDDHRFTLDPTSPAHLCLVVESADGEAQKPPAVVRVTDCDNPLEVALKDVLEAADQSLELPGAGASVRAEVDLWAML